MTLATTALREAADRLIAAADVPRQCDPVRDILGDNDIAAAYSVLRADDGHPTGTPRWACRATPS